MKFLREMISRKAEAASPDGAEDYGFEGFEEEDQEALRGLTERLSEQSTEDVSGDFVEDDDLGETEDEGLVASSDQVIFDDEEQDFENGEADHWDEESSDDGFEEDDDFVSLEASDDATDEFEEDGSDYEAGDGFDDWDEEDSDEPEIDSAASDVSNDNDEVDPVPELTAADVERAMKLRKKMWTDVGEEGSIVSEPAEPEPTPEPAKSDLEAYRPVSRPVTRPTTRPTSRSFQEVSDSRIHKPDEITEDEPVQKLDPPSSLEDSLAQVTQDDQVSDQHDTQATVSAISPEAVNEETEPADDTSSMEEVGGAEEDEVTVESLMAAAAAAKAAEPDFPEEFEDIASIADISATGRGGRQAGRVKTRLLGFQADDAEGDVFGAERNLPGQTTQFPVGWIVVTDGPGRGMSFSLGAGVSLIGRGADQAIRLDFGDNAISRDNHASVAYDDEMNQFFLGHGGKSNIVRLNDRPVLTTEELSDGDIIRIGETTLKFTALCGGEFSWNEDHGGNADRAAIA